MSQSQAAQAYEGARKHGLRGSITYSEGDINQPELTHGKHGLRIQASRGRYNDAICTSQVIKKYLF